MKQTLENVTQLDIRYLKKIGKLEPGSITTLMWHRGNVVIEQVKLFIDEDSIEMNGGKIYFDRTPCHYGGERKWLLCTHCNKRSAVLYSNEFVCRHCIGLHYGCQHEVARDRLRRKSKKFKDTKFAGHSEWIKPKFQHRSTYIQNREIQCRLTEVENEMDRATLASMRIQMTM